MRKRSCSVYRLTAPITTGGLLWACIARAVCFLCHTWSSQQQSEIVLALDASSEWRTPVTQGSEFSSAQSCWALLLAVTLSVACLPRFPRYQLSLTGERPTSGTMRL